MSIRGSVTLECDTKGCEAELVVGDLDFDATYEEFVGIVLALYAHDWVMDDDGGIHCPQCCEENPRDRDEDDGLSGYSDPRDERDERRHA